jgi:hypothetical protein
MTRLRVIEGGAMPAPDVLRLVTNELEHQTIGWYAARMGSRRWTPTALPELAAHLGVELQVAREVVRRLLRTKVLDSCAGLQIRVCTLEQVISARIDRDSACEAGVRLLLELGAHLDPCAPLPGAPEPTTASDDDVRSDSRKAEPR